MNNESEYQYNRCISRGICSINPTTAALQEVIILYLKQLAFYGLKLEELGVFDRRIYNLVLNTLSILSSNYEISTTNFLSINSSFQIELPRIIKEYESRCTQSECEKLNTDLLLKDQTDINEYIRYGEKEFYKRIQASSVDILNLYRTLFLLTKSYSINILTYESYGFEVIDEVSWILKILNLQNTITNEKEELKQVILETSEKDRELMTQIRSSQEKCYGKQNEYEVSFSTKKGKAVLVVGSNLRELEMILESFQDTDIDVYTHDNMMLAHTFPKFKEYKNLKGQYGQGMENCLLDFSTFPGPIILTRNSLYNVENLYRGRLFTTDFAYSKGVIQIKNNDFSEVIKSAQEARGFKTGKICASEYIGFCFESACKKIYDKLNNGDYTNIIIVGTRGYSKEENEYFQSFRKRVSENTLVISMFCCKEQNNIICFNAIYDELALIKVYEYVVNNFSQNINVFFPICDRHTLSLIFSLSNRRENKLFVGTWNQMVLKPNILDELTKEFGINRITTPKQDLALLYNL